MAVGVGGPLDGTVLGVATPEQYEIRMSDDSVHLYLRSGRVVAAGLGYEYAGRT